jgi:Niemann-Pick C2 protein
MSVSYCVISLFVICVFYSGVESIKWKVCDGVKATADVKSVMVTGCESTDICILKKGLNATFQVDFLIHEDSSSAKAVVHGIIEHIPVPFSLANPDGCKDSGMTCPLKNGNDYHYQTYIYVDPRYPSIRLVVKWELQDQSGNDIFCIMLGAEIQTAQDTKDNTLRFLQKKKY